MTASPDSTLINPHSSNYDNPFQIPLNPFQGTSQPHSLPFDHRASSLFPQQPLNVSGFSSSGFQAPGASFLEQLEGEEEELNKKNSIISEKDLVDISTYSSEEREEHPADYTAYFAGRSNEMGNLTQPFTPSSRPQFSEISIRSPKKFTPPELVHAPSSPPLEATHTSDLESEGELTPVLPTGRLRVKGEVPTEELLSKSNSLVRKVTSLLECKRFDADEFIKTLESEIKPRTEYRTEQPHLHQSPPSTPLGYQYTSVPEMYLTPQPPTPLPPPTRERDQVAPSSPPEVYLPSSRPLQWGHELDAAPPDNLLSRLSGDSLDERDAMGSQEGFTDLSLLEYPPLSTSADDVSRVPVPRDRYGHTVQHSLLPTSPSLYHSTLTTSADDVSRVPVPRDRYVHTVQHSLLPASPSLYHSTLTTSADDVSRVPVPRDRHTNTAQPSLLPTSPVLQHSALTTSADDVRDTSRPERRLSNTSLSVPEGLDKLSDNKLPTSPRPPLAGLGVTDRRASIEELTPKQLLVDLELCDAGGLSCCIGTIEHAYLRLTNMSPCWVQTQLEFKTVKLGAEYIDTKSEHMPFSMYNRCILGTSKSEQVKLSFAPTGPPGLFTVTLDVFISKIVDACSSKPTKTFTLTAEAIKPEIAIVYPNKESKVLDFGYVREGKCYEQCLTIVNQSKCSIPLLLSVPARNSSLHLSLTPPSERRTHPVKESSALSTNLEGAGEGVRGRLELWVSFKPTHSLPSSGRRSPFPAPSELSTAVELLLDSQYATSACKRISTVPVTASFSQADLVILESVDTLRFETQLSRSLARSFTLHNRGPHPLTLTMQLDPTSHDFAVFPSQLYLQPAQQSTATVEYRPSVPESTYTGILQILSSPGDKRQVLKVLARADPPESPPVPQGANPSSSGGSYLLSNILSLSWGGTQLDECVERKIVLFNTSEEDLMLDIQLNSPFFFVKDSNGKYQPFLNTTISSRAKIPVAIAFSPTDPVTYSDNLSITDISHNKVFQIPLTGYGGRSQIILVNAEQTSDGYWMNIGEVKRSERNVFKLYLHNSGVRKAYIRAVCRDNQPGKPVLSTPYVSITPSEFIIAPQDHKSILVTFSPRPDHIALCDTSPHRLAYVHVTTGDCIAAKIYFSQLQNSGGAVPAQFEYLNKLFSLDNSEDEDFSQFPFDSHQLSPPTETDISVPLLGYPPTPSPSPSPTVPRRRPSSVPVSHTQTNDLYLHRGSSSRGPSPHKQISPDVSPVLSRRSSGALASSPSPVDKLRASPKPVYHRATQGHKLSSQDLFTVYPSQLTINSNARDPAKLYIRNLSQTVAKFAVVFPKHFVAVSPARGSVDPGQERQLLVSSLLTDLADLPSSVTEYLTIHYEDSVKSVPLHMQMEFNSPCTPVRESFTSVIKYLSPPNILFSPIKNNTVADLPITISNPHDFPIHWSLSSMGQTAYQQQDRGALDILKTNYAVFFFHRLSGGLASKGTSSISVTFQPRNPGTYSQSWEMQLTKGVKVIDGIKLSVSGKAEDVSFPSVKRACSDSHRESEDKPTDNAFKPPRRRVYLEPDILNYPQTKPHTTQMMKASVFNKSDDPVKFSVDDLSAPFSVHKQHVQFTVGPRHCARLPVNFSPQALGYFEEVLVVRTSAGQKLYSLLKAESSFYTKTK